MSYTYRPDALRGRYADKPVWDEFYDRAYFCILLRVSPQYYDNMTDLEHDAWVNAYNDIQKAQQKGA